MDLLGQAGGYIRKDLHEGRIFNQVAWRATLFDVVALTNQALAAGDHKKAAQARRILFEGLAEKKKVRPAAAEMSLKACRNELIRVYMEHGWYQEAEEVARAALEGLEIDRFCPNRESILRETLARVLFASGQLETGRNELDHALQLSRSNLEKVHSASQQFPDSCILGERGSEPPEP